MGHGRGENAEGRGARPGWPLKGWPSWRGHFNRPQLNHCRKPLTASYSLSRTALLLGSQAVMQKDRQPGPLTTHPRPQGQPAPNSGQPPKRVLVFESKAGDPALIWRNPPLPCVPSFSALLLRVWGLSEAFTPTGARSGCAARLIPGLLGACPCPLLLEAGLQGWQKLSLLPLPTRGTETVAPPPRAVSGSSRTL